MSKMPFLILPLLIGVGLTIGMYYKFKIERQSKGKGIPMTFDSLIEEVKRQLVELQERDDTVDSMTKEEYDVALATKMRLSRALKNSGYPGLSMQEATTVKVIEDVVQFSR